MLLVDWFQATLLPSSIMVDLLIDSAAKSFLLMAIVAGLAAIAYRSSAALRHWLWTLGIVCTLMLPVFSFTLPRLEIPYLTSMDLQHRMGWTSPSASEVALNDATRPTNGDLLRSPGVGAPSPSLGLDLMSGSSITIPLSERMEDHRIVNMAHANDFISNAVKHDSELLNPSSSNANAATKAFLDGVILGRILLTVWLVGVFVYSLSFCISWKRASQLTKESNPIDLSQLGLSVKRISQRDVDLLGSRLRISNESVTPYVTGLFRPMIVLPHDALEWSDDRKLAVMLHELAHIQRRDLQSQFLATVCAVLYWFNPLVWLAASRLRIERELACDDRVVLLGQTAADYAQHLLQIARQYRDRHAQVNAAMVRPKDIERRINALLDKAIPHLQLSRISAFLLLVAFVALSSSLAILAPSRTRAQNQEDSNKPLGQVVKPDTKTISSEVSSAASPALTSAPQDRENESLPKGAVAMLGTNRYRQNGSYKSIAWTNKEEVFAVGSRDDTVRLWDATTGKLVRKVELNGNRLGPWAMSVDGKTIALFIANQNFALGKQTTELIIEDCLTGERRTLATSDELMRDAVRTISFSADNAQIAIALGNGKLTIIDIATAKNIRVNELDIGGTSAIAFAPNGRSIAVAGIQYAGIVQWPFRDPMQKLPGLERGAQAVAYSKSGKLLAVGSDEPMAARIWDSDSRQWFHELRGNATTYYREQVAFSSDDRFLMVPANGEVEVFDIVTGKLEKTLSGGGSETRVVAVSPNNKYVASAGSRSTLQVWKFDTGELISSRFEGHNERPYEIEFSPDDQRVYSGCLEGNLLVWDVATASLIHKLRHGTWIRSLAVSKDGHRLATCSGDDTLRVWKASDMSIEYELLGHLRLGGNQHTALQFSDDGFRLFSFGVDFMLRTWDLTTGKLASEHPIRSASVKIEELPGGRADPWAGKGVALMNHSADFDAKGQLVLSMGVLTETYSSETGKLVSSEQLGEDSKLSPDNSKRAIIQKNLPGRSASIRIVEQSAGNMLFQTDDATHGAEFAFSPDSKRIAYRATRSAQDIESGMSPRCVRVRKLSSSEDDYVFDLTESNSGWPMRFSHDGSKLATSMESGAVCIWDVR